MDNFQEGYTHGCVTWATIGLGGGWTLSELASHQADFGLSEIILIFGIISFFRDQKKLK